MTKTTPLPKEMTGLGEEGHGVLEDRHDDRVVPGEMIALVGEHHRDLPGGWALPRGGCRRLFGAAPPGGPFGDDAQAATETVTSETPPELGATPAAARPGFVEQDEPGLERACADAEDIVALVAQDAQDGLPAAARPHDELLPWSYAAMV
ncbi:hypothetical protein KTN05_16680 [Paracoccus sp. Z118]|nr:hypothetical protein [Paracoccus sp. Z118]